jgi:hypothetical protein
MFRWLGCGQPPGAGRGTHWRGFHRRDSGVKVSSVSREVVGDQAQQLRRIAGFLESGSASGHWGGPAERECARHVHGLITDLRDVARALGIAGEYAGIHSVMARL